MGYGLAMRGVQAPCYGCKERKLGCHGACAKYKAFQEEREVYRHRNDEHYRYRGYMTDAVSKGRNTTIGQR